MTNNYKDFLEIKFITLCGFLHDLESEKPINVEMCCMVKDEIDQVLKEFIRESGSKAKAEWHSTICKEIGAKLGGLELFCGLKYKIVNEYGKEISIAQLVKDHFEIIE